ncbi:hypothetical protein CXB51_019081 [Gossypium anomalum]|uniref:Aminotransferase-like plant mobile domain-containing protein n=1 Tax=Gossypium anomalum TaxID=47600 RepID=A0A8J5ZCP5_9ROSI|nr:hypothetical protein CXB51_019081 [Gossypium anomalum]
MVERWRPETHTFHLPCGKCTITLKDMHLQLGLPVDRSVVIGETNVVNFWFSSGDDLWRYPNDKQVTNTCPLRWLLKLIDFRGLGELNKGSVVFETLYREMYRATQPGKIKIDGCILLLQPWPQYRFLFLHPRANYQYIFSLVTRWNHGPSHMGLPAKLQDIQLLLDQQSEVELEWMRYEDPTIREVIPDEFFVNSNIWHVNVPLVVYATIEIHETDRVLR